VCLNGIKGSKEGSERENVKIAGGNSVDCNFFMLKISFTTNLWRKRDCKW
jgi:hypothetical protein